MSEHTFSAVLTFALLAGGTIAIGSELVGPSDATAPSAVTAQATLPMVTVVGKRAAPTELAVETRASAPVHFE